MSDHITTIPLRWGDFDRFGHVTNTAYLELAQEARTLWARDRFDTKGHEIPAVFIRKLEVEYLRPVMPSQSEVEVRTRVNHVGKTSFSTTQDIVAGGEVAATVTTVAVAVDFKTATPRAITAREAKILMPPAEK
ncbi:acyl-CoA thioesterase [Corynebacterium kozikiae]|uniref:acyl-CoA thioesterase n=1 Tax=Corynebacterium kozikiae TaxID=2968469 RepID=UPI00211CDE7E|nr:thioesterase family protein [Corynebacterium sp. 76QC2CO]MCQ9343247.1 thioesterase family protein [Corynebacterium sp. 76QC2CO]